MCTVTFLPLPSNGFILTSNRDESIDRKKAIQPKKFEINNVSVLYPKDEHANGTWILTSSNHFTLCLLNGAFEFHTSTPPYRKSRGLLLLDFFLYNNLEEFVSQYNFEGIEPFTLLIISSFNKPIMNELRWDGLKITNTAIDTSSPHIWSSVTLYSAEVIAQRKLWFKEWLFNNPHYTSEDILKFHHFGGIGDEQNALIMQRNNRKQTVSISSISRTSENSSFFYKDLLANKSSCKMYA